MTQKDLDTAKEQFAPDGWVYFSKLNPELRKQFEQFCGQHGCTLTIVGGKESAAPWSDFKAFLLGVAPDD